MATMLEKWLYNFTGHLPLRVITAEDGDGQPARPIIERYYLGKLFGFTFYIHRFVRSDPNTGLHNHPWSLSASLILVRGYLEDRFRGVGEKGCDVETRRHRPGRVRMINSHTLHRVRLIKGGHCWTLFCHRPRKYRWGFMRPIDGLGVPAVRFDLMPESDGAWHLDAVEGNQHAMRASLQ